MVEQWTVNPEVEGSSPSAPVSPLGGIGRRARLKI